MRTLDPPRHRPSEHGVVNTPADVPLQAPGGKPRPHRADQHVHGRLPGILRGYSRDIALLDQRRGVPPRFARGGDGRVGGGEPARRRFARARLPRLAGPHRADLFSVDICRVEHGGLRAGVAILSGDEEADAGGVAVYL